MDERECQSQAARIEQLLREVAAFPDPQQRAKTEDLLRNLLDLYGTGLARLLEITAQAEVSGLKLIETFAQDELVGSLLLLHGLHPVELETRILQAVEGVRTSVQKHGGTIEFERLEDGVAYLRVTGVGHGCASAALTQLIEEAMYSAAPDLEDVRLQEVTAPKPVKFMPTRRRKESTPAIEESGDQAGTRADEQASAPVHVPTDGQESTQISASDDQHQSEQVGWSGNGQISATAGVGGNANDVASTR